MKIQRKEIVTYDLSQIIAYIPMRRVHLEDIEDPEFVKAMENMVIKWREGFSENTEFNKRNYDKVLMLNIDIDEGRLRNWTNGVSGEIFIKACDEGLYQYIYYDAEEQGNILVEFADYVPQELEISDTGYGDYICFNVNTLGYIENWHEYKGLISNTISAYATETEEYD